MRQKKVNRYGVEFDHGYHIKKYPNYTFYNMNIINGDKEGLYVQGCDSNEYLEYFLFEKDISIARFSTKVTDTIYITNYKGTKGFTKLKLINKQYIL